MNPMEIAALDELDLLVVVDNESDTLSSVDKGVPQLPVAADHLIEHYDVLGVNLGLIK